MVCLICFDSTPHVGSFFVGLILVYYQLKLILGHALDVDYPVCVRVTLQLGQEVRCTPNVSILPLCYHHV
jgi:hypothetical protein